MQPVWTPDGRRIVRAQRRAELRIGSLVSRRLRWRDRRRKQTVFETPDLSVEDFALTPDGRTIVFTRRSDGRVNIYRFRLPAARPRDRARRRIGGAEPARTTVVFASARWRRPPD